MELLHAYLKSAWDLHVTCFFSFAGKVISTFIHQATSLFSAEVNEISRVSPTKLDTQFLLMNAVVIP